MPSCCFNIPSRCEPHLLLGPLSFLLRSKVLVCSPVHLSESWISLGSHFSCCGQHEQALQCLKKKHHSKTEVVLSFQTCIRAFAVYPAVLGAFPMLRFGLVTFASQMLACWALCLLEDAPVSWRVLLCTINANRPWNKPVAEHSNNARSCFNSQQKLY